MLPTTAPYANKAVLVTGCSSGIGRASAVYLAERGYTVLATVRRETDAASLRSLGLPTLVPVCPLDLTKPDEIAGALETIRRELAARQINGLYAVVNNAGAGSIAPLELLDIDHFQRELQARILAPVALLQGLLPLIRQAQGRVVWIVTPAIIPIRYVASIHACDFAVNCLARTLQLELQPWRIPSIMIRCGGVQTAAAAKSVETLSAAFEAWPPERFALYADSLRREQAELARFDERRSEPVEVAKVVARALDAARPRRRYRIGYLAGFAALLEYLPQTWVDAIMARRA